MTMDEYGDSCAPQVVTRFNVSDCSQLASTTSDSGDSDTPSSWSILQRDSTFGAGWSSVFYTRLAADAEPLFLISPPPISARMHVIMEGIFAAVIVPEYAQLMGVNHKAPAANKNSGNGNDNSGGVDDYKYIPVTMGYHVDVKSSFASPPLPSIKCAASTICSGAGNSSSSGQQVCESTALPGSGRRAVATLVTSDSYLQGALVLLYALPALALFCFLLLFVISNAWSRTLAPLTPSAVTAYYRMAAYLKQSLSPLSQKK